MPPSYTPRQRAFFGAELGRERAGKPTVTGLGEKKLKEFASAVKPPAKPPVLRRRKPPGAPAIPSPPSPAKPPALGDTMAVKTPGPTGRY